jgi:hypothetical protein
MSAEFESPDRGRRQALTELWDRYSEARAQVPSGPPIANLEWILGPKGNRFDNAGALDSKMIELLALWLDDLATEVDQPVLLIAGAGESHPDGNSLARRLRAATKAFLVAFRRH